MYSGIHRSDQSQSATFQLKLQLRGARIRINFEFSNRHFESIEIIPDYIGKSESFRLEGPHFFEHRLELQHLQHGPLIL